MLQKTFDLAVQHHRAGRLGDAECLYRQVLARQPDNPHAVHYLGMIAFQMRQRDAAVELIKRAIALNPDIPEAHCNLGNALRDKGQFDEAIAAYQRAIALVPGHATAHCNLGNALRDKGELNEAITAYHRAIALNPHFAEAYSNLGVALMDAGQHDAAIAALRQSIAIKPDFSDAQINLGAALMGKGDFHAAIAACRQAVALNGNSPEAHSALGNALKGKGLFDEAIAAYRKAVALRPSYAEAYCNLGTALVENGQPNEAIAAYRQAIALRPDLPEPHLNLGSALKDNGRVDEAIAAYRRAIALRPSYGNCHWNLAQARRFSNAADPDLAAMQSLARNISSLSEDDRIALHFALGKAYADVGWHERAIHHLMEGNSLDRRQRQYDEAAELSRLQRVKAVFTPELIEQKNGIGDPSDVPVFILGMPRSGTTLVEQVLASHPAVFGAGELRDVSSLVVGWNHEPIQFPEVVRLIGREDLRRLGARHASKISALAPAAKKITDKMPSNFPFAGFIHLVLPNARIIHTRRDPVDTCFSCYSYRFIKGDLEWSCDLGELGRYYRAYASLMDHWRRVLPDGVMLDVQYEDFVTDFEAQARRIVAFCGLEWDDRCLAFHKTQRSIRTASAVQVRQPIYRSSIGRWKPYKHMLQPLLSELGEIAD